MTDTLKPASAPKPSPRPKPQATTLWSTMPGWGIVANLLPPEIIVARRVRVLRKVVVGVLVAVALLGAGGYAYAYWKTRSAESELHAAESRTVELQTQQHRYDGVVQIEAETAQIKTQLGGLLSNDVDLPKLATAVLTLSPSRPGISKLDVEVTAAATQPSSAGVDSGVLDTSGHQHIGTITVTGTVRSMSDVATYVTRLAQLPGIVEVFPSNQQNDGKLVTYSIAMTMTDQLFSNRYAAATTTATTGGN